MPLHLTAPGCARAPLARGAIVDARVPQVSGMTLASMNDEMADSNSFVCATCGETHEGIPGLSFDAPFHYNQMSPDERSASAFLNTDVCSIAGEDFFVRGCLEIPVHGQEEPFIWGVWVSLSKSNFDRYVETIGTSALGEGPHFGWLCSRLPGYPDTLHLKTNVHFRAGGLRPLVEVEPTDHPLAVDQRDGMSAEAIRRIVEANLHQGHAG